MKNKLKWHIRYMDLAKNISLWSKDPSTKVGAIAVRDGRVISQGYNGFPRSIIDFDLRYENKDIKYTYIVHAEANVIYNSSYEGISLKDADLYIYGLPCCSECTLGIIQSGIKNIYIYIKNEKHNWKESWEVSKVLLEEARIKYYILNDFYDIDKEDTNKELIFHSDEGQ